MNCHTIRGWTTAAFCVYVSISVQLIIEADEAVHRTSWEWHCIQQEHLWCSEIPDTSAAFLSFQFSWNDHIEEKQMWNAKVKNFEFLSNEDYGFKEWCLCVRVAGATKSSGWAGEMGAVPFLQQLKEGRRMRDRENRTENEWPTVSFGPGTDGACVCVCVCLCVCVAMISVIHFCQF